jgi:hypothetical protein
MRIWSGRESVVNSAIEMFSFSRVECSRSPTTLLPNLSQLGLSTHVYIWLSDVAMSFL